jgi:hypothetical protein
VYRFPHCVPPVRHVRYAAAGITVCITEAFASPHGMRSPENGLQIVVLLSSFLALSSFDDWVIGEGARTDLR